MNDINIVQQGDSTTFEKQKNELEQATKCLNAETDKTLAKRANLVALMTDHNQNNHFQGRLRALFLAWARHTKSQYHFARCIRNTVQKAMWQRAFQNIREFSRDKDLTRKQNSAAAKMRNMFWRRTCGAAMSKWRQTEYF